MALSFQASTPKEKTVRVGRTIYPDNLRIFSTVADTGIDGEHDQPDDDRDHVRRGYGVTGGAGFGTADSAGTGGGKIDLSRFSGRNHPGPY